MLCGRYIRNNGQAYGSNLHQLRLDRYLHLPVRKAALRLLYYCLGGRCPPRSPSAKGNIFPLDSRCYAASPLFLTIFVNLVELLEIAYLLIALIQHLFNIRPLKSLICTKHHYMIEKIVYLIHKLVIIAVLCGNNSLSSFLAYLLADLVHALVEKVAGI